MSTLGWFVCLWALLTTLNAWRLQWRVTKLEKRLAGIAVREERPTPVAHGESA